MKRRTFLALGATAPVASESPVLDAARALRTLNDVPGMVAFNGPPLVDAIRQRTEVQLAMFGEAVAKQLWGRP